MAVVGREIGTVFDLKKVDYEILDLTPEEYDHLGIYPTEVRVITHGDSFMVHVPALGEFGHGKTIEAALEDLSRGIKWFYSFLLSRNGDLTDGLADDLEAFDSLVSREP